jgi:glc operon protein GlcG
MAKSKVVFSIGLLLLATATGAQPAKFGTKPVITLAIAKQLAAAILKASCKVAPPPGERPIVKNGVDGDCIGSVAIADDGGTVFYVETLDGTQAPSIQMAIEKARTAAMWRRPTSKFHEAIQKGTNMSYLDGSFPLTSAEGGEPLYLGNDCVGGIGFSGQNPDNVMAAALAEWKKITDGK